MELPENESNNSILAAIILIVSGIVLLLVCGMGFYFGTRGVEPTWDARSGGQTVDVPATAYVFSGVFGIACVLAGFIQLRNKSNSR
jgi:hypothetical protein